MISKRIKKGFTIVELVIVIAVIGILAAVLIPTFSNVIQSANEARDLQEAQNSLKAYTAYVTSQGSELSDGAVFKVNNSHYVFFKGSLHKFEVNKDGTEAAPKGTNKYAVLEEGPKVSIGNVYYACDATFKLMDKEEAVKIGEEDVNFYYYSKAFVEFDDGSKKTEIYVGTICVGNLKDEDKYKNLKVEVDGESLYTGASATLYNPDNIDYENISGTLTATNGTKKEIISIAKNIVVLSDTIVGASGTTYEVDIEVDMGLGKYQYVGDDATLSSDKIILKITSQK